MKKILTIIPYSYIPYYSGGQKSLAVFNAYLGEKTELHVAGTLDNDTSLINTYQFHPTLGKSKFRYINPILPISIIKLIKRYKIETVIFEHPYLGWLIPIIRAATSTKIICRTHNIESERFRSIGKRWWRILATYERWVLNICDIVTCITDADMRFMTKTFHLNPSKCIVAPYGIDEKESPSDKIQCKKTVCSRHQLNPDIPLLFFNGLMSYKPNLDALDMILYKINPILESKQFKCNILIAGKGLPEQYQQLKNYNLGGIFYVGFVNDIIEYTKAADILLNPVIIGGGIKTKVVEALGYGTSVVSTVSGAIGIDPLITNNKLQIVKDNDWDAFAEKTITCTANSTTSTPESFYKIFYWGNIVDQILNNIDPK
jgi:glycosyltransferase involved in cell wall biosynthesis